MDEKKRLVFDPTYLFMFMSDNQGLYCNICDNPKTFECCDITFENSYYVNKFVRSLS